MNNHERINRLLLSNQDLANTNKRGSEITKISIRLLESVNEKQQKLLNLCGKTYSYLQMKNNKTWEEEKLCQALFEQLTGLPIQK